MDQPKGCLYSVLIIFLSDQKYQKKKKGYINKEVHYKLSNELNITYYLIYFI